MSKKDWPDRTGETQECIKCKMQGRKTLHIVTAAENKSNLWDCPVCGKTNVVHADDTPDWIGYVGLAVILLGATAFIIYLAGWNPILGVLILFVGVAISVFKGFSK